MFPGHLCWLHYRGVPPTQAPFFIAGCRRCEDKRARGVVTGNEPAPGETFHAQRNKQARGARIVAARRRGLAQ